MNPSHCPCVYDEQGSKNNVARASRPCASYTNTGGTPVPRKLAAMCLMFAVAAVVGCSHQSAPSEPPRSPLTTQAANDSAAVPGSGQEQFQTPQDAAAALKKAVDAGDRRQLIGIFGNEGRQLILTGDRVQEDNDMQAFASRMSEQTRVELPSPDRAVLYIGDTELAVSNSDRQKRGQMVFRYGRRKRRIAESPHRRK